MISAAKDKFSSSTSIHHHSICIVKCVIKKDCLKKQSIKKMRLPAFSQTKKN